MPSQTASNEAHDRDLVRVLSVFAIVGTLALTLAIAISAVVVPDYDWIADTISDLGAGRYEFIVDTGLYAYSASFIALALVAAHLHMGGWRWSMGLVCLAALGLIIFLVGARNEYGDSDNEGVVIHIYLVYALGFFQALAPWLLAKGVAEYNARDGRVMAGYAAVWTLSAPIFFMLPNSIDGIYERYLGLVSGAFVIYFAWFFLRFNVDE